VGNDQRVNQNDATDGPSNEIFLQCTVRGWLRAKSSRPVDFASAHASNSVDQEIRIFTECLKQNKALALVKYEYVAMYLVAI
jgi:hypothetical protein